jgi:predicted aspartyl protease
MVDVNVFNHDDEVLARTGNLPSDKIRKARIPALVDTGSSHLVLPKKIADQLGLRITGRVAVRYADQRRATRSVVEDVSVEVLGRRGVFRAVLEPARVVALVGVIILEDLDLLVDPRNQTLQPRDPKTIISAIE